MSEIFGPPSHLFFFLTLIYNQNENCVPCDQQLASLKVSFEAYGISGSCLIKTHPLEVFDAAVKRMALGGYEKEKERRGDFRHVKGPSI